MEKSNSQHFLFAFEAIPILFHSQTTSFINYIQKDGTKFLRFWWDHVGDKLEEANHSPFEGMNFELQELGKNTHLVIITLPKPRRNEEAHYLALLAKPEKRFAWVRLPNTRVFALRRTDGIHEQHATTLGELTPRALFRPLATGIEPSKQAFKKAVDKLIGRKQK